MRGTKKMKVRTRLAITMTAAMWLMSFMLVKRKKAQGAEIKALRQTEAKYRSLFENSVEGMYQTTPAGQFIDANPAMARMLGYESPRELLSNVTSIPQQLYVEPELRSQLTILLGRHDTVEGYEVQLYRKDGSVIWVSLSACAMRDDTGKVVHYEGIAKDITERKRAEEALRLSEARYRTLHHDIPTMIFTLDTKGTVLSVNPYGASQLGYDIEELEGKSVLSVFHQDDRDAVVEQLEECLLNPGQVYHWQFRKIRKDGGLLWVEELAQAVYDLGGALNILVVCQNVTERKRAEAFLNGQNHILEMIATNAPLKDVLDGLVRLIESQSIDMLGSILLLDEDGIHVRHGAAPSLPVDYVQAIDGASIGPLAGSCGTAMYRKEAVIVTDIIQDPLWTNYRDLITPYGFRACCSTPIISRQGQVLGSFAMYFRESRAPSLAETQLIEMGVFLAGIAIERKRGDESLRQAHEASEQRVIERTRELSEANAKLQELDRLKSMFIASMSHELRTPLNSVIGFASIMFEEWMGAINTEQKENLAAILRAGKHLLALVNDVIDVSKIEAGKIEPILAEFDLYQLVEEAVDLVAIAAQEKGLDLTVEAIHLTMRTDRRRLLQCVANLLSNAVKFTEKGSVRVTVNLAEGGGLQLSDASSILEIGFINISVEDTGIGIQEEDLPKLFQPFVRLVTPQAIIPGTGLGLYLTRRLVMEVLKGDIMCESTYGKGSIFALRIPVRIQ